MPPPTKPLNDSKENIELADKKVPGPSSQAHNALNAYHNQLQPNVPDDDNLDEDSSLISELKTPTSGMQQNNVPKNEYLTPGPSASIVSASHTQRRNY